MDKPPRKYSDDRRERREPAWKRERKNRFDDRVHEESRERTRERQNNRRNVSRSRGNNQRYLESMYSMHYNQMMQLYNGTNNFQQNPPVQQNPVPNQQPSLFGNGPAQNQPNQQPSLFGNMPAQNQLNMPVPPPNFSHNNVAQFGSAQQPQPFYGQSFPPNMYQGNPNWNGGQNPNQP